MSAIHLSLIICTHNPRMEVLRKTIEHMRALELDSSRPIELVIVDNASTNALDPVALQLGDFPFPARIVQEPTPGLTNARLRGFHSTEAPLLLYADDDNFLRSDYVMNALDFFAAHPQAGAVSGRVLAQAEFAFPVWMSAEMVHHYAVRDLGEGAMPFRGPDTPYGAGMVLRREAMAAVIGTPFVFSDRVGKKLSSGGDCELCYRIKTSGWELWYAGNLELTHYLYQSRLCAEYYERFQYAFGYDKPVMEMFWAPGRPWRRLTYIKRAASLTWKLWRWPKTVIVEDPAPVLLSRFDRAWHQGLRDSLLHLAWGPPIWLRVKTLRPE